MNIRINDIRQRLASAISGSNYTGDTLHENLAADYGYPTALTFLNFWSLYRRLGLAKNVVELPVNTCWMSKPHVKSTDQFEKEFKSVVEGVKLWTRVRGLDVRQRVGRYGGLFMRVRDGKNPSEPIDGMLNGPGSLMSAIPLYEGQLKVLEVDNDPMSDRYGSPITYQYDGSGVGSRNEKEQGSFTIHHTRLVMAAEGADDGGIYGIPALEAAYNSLMDIRKIIGAGGEGFYRNAAQSVVFNLKDTASANINTELLEAFNEKFDEFTKDRFRRGLWTPGLEPKVLEAILPDPENFFQNALQDVAASCGIPSTILTGEQTGRLASNEDSRSFLSSMNSRRENFLTDLVKDVVDWLIRYGVLPDAGYDVYWNDLMALSTSERLTNAREVANICREAYQAGLQAPFNDSDIRKVAGFEAFDYGVENPEEEIPSEELPEDMLDGEED